jgi:uncharacterized membrane-anchored protein YitT (DUF2179 family)
MGKNEYGCADAMNLLYTINEFSCDEETRKARIAALQSMQDPETGLFHEKTHHAYHTVAHCTGALQLFDVKPLYPIKEFHKFLESGEELSVIYTLSSQPLLELVFAVMLTGIGSAIIFRCKASSGGTDIIALILKKYTSLNVGTALLLSDIVIAASSIFVFSLEIGLFSLLGLFAKVFVVDDILDSMNLCKAFTIITTKPVEISEYIMTKMHRGATIYNAEGVYSHEEKKVLITVCRRSEALKLRKKVKEIDEHSFMVITKTSEIMGKGFRDVQ